jgi:hypothetical protein
LFYGLVGNMRGHQYALRSRRKHGLRQRGAFSPRGQRYFGVGLLAALMWFAIADHPATAQGTPQAVVPAPPAPASYSEAVQFLAHEQSAAEQYAVILDRFGKNDTTRYVQGITRYADAKADFDGLIEALKTDLIDGRNPSSSPKLGDALRAAAEKRVAFTTFVADKVVGDTEGARGVLPDVIKVVPDLIKALTESGISIWKEYSTAGKERRDAIRDELDHLKWKSFADIAKT